MSDHIEEIAFLSSVLTQIAARIEALKLRAGVQTLAQEANQLRQEIQNLKNEVKE